MPFDLAKRNSMDIVWKHLTDFMGPDRKAGLDSGLDFGLDSGLDFGLTFIDLK